MSTPARILCAIDPARVIVPHSSMWSVAFEMSRGNRRSTQSPSVLNTQRPRRWITRRK
jgi:hypothetical protein